MIADRIYQLAQLVKSLVPIADRCWFRIVDHQGEFLAVREDQVEPPESTRDLGIYIEISHRNGQGYACTNDLSSRGIQKALAHAKSWAEFSAASQLVKPVVIFTVHRKNHGIRQDWEQRLIFFCKLQQRVRFLRNLWIAIFRSGMKNLKLLWCALMVVKSRKRLKLFLREYQFRLTKVFTLKPGHSMVMVFAGKEE